MYVPIVGKELFNVLMYNKVMQMKRFYIFLLMLLITGGVAQAQLTHYGVRLGLGPSFVSDDLLTKSPILGGDLGGFVNFSLPGKNNAFADNLYFQTGLYLTRRGTRFDQEFVGMRSYREGRNIAYYAQIPVLVSWRWELPLMVADQYLNFYFGPAVNVGLFGDKWDRRVTLGYPQESVNYDTHITGGPDADKIFKHIRRFDVSLKVGFGYQFGNFTYDFYWDHGFVTLQKEADVLNDLERENYENGSSAATEEPKERNGYTGVNNIFMVSIGYLIPWQY